MASDRPNSELKPGAKRGIHLIEVQVLGEPGGTAPPLQGASGSSAEAVEACRYDLTSPRSISGS